MNKEQLIEKLKVIVSPYTEEQAALADLTEKTDFITDLKINSANLVDIVLDIEEQFGITIDDEAMGKMLTVKATVAVIEDKLRAHAGQ